MKRLVYVLMAALPLVLCLLLGGCGDNPRAVSLLARADSLMAGRPDSALLILDSLLTDSDRLSTNFVMQCRLRRLNAINKLDTVFTTAHVAQARILADHFDDHGTSNEQMLAYYLLGRTYADAGEAPQAINAYNEAANRADTTATDCDYKTLCRVYSQMAKIFYRQGLYHEDLYYHDCAVRCGYKAGDTLAALLAYSQKMGAYKMLMLPDSMLYVSETASKLLRQAGYTTLAAGVLCNPIRYLVDQGDYSKAQRYLNIYEKESGYFDSCQNIISGREIYYYTKGYYYLKTCQYDSAEYFFRKELATGKDFNNQNAGSQGLALLFLQTHKPDSAAKYALYSYEMNDSAYAQKATEEVAKTKAMYDYTRHQRKAEKAEHQLLELHYRFVVVAFVAIILIALFLLYVKRRRAKMLKEYQELNTKYVASLNQYALNKKETELLKEAKESDELLIHQLQCEKAIDADTISKLTRKVERKKEKIKQNEDDLRKQAKAIAEFQKDKKRPDQWNMEEGLFNLPLLSHLHASIARGRQPSDSQFDEIIELTNSMLPTFIPRILELYPTINHTNLLFCVFTKLRFINSERAVIFNMTYQSVTNRCAFLYKKFTGKKGGAGDFEVEIQKMG